MSKLRVGPSRYGLDEAFEVVVGYAFATRDLGWRRRRGHVGDEPEGRRARWAYRTYDCIPPSPGTDLAGIDFLIADGLNGQMRARTVAALLAVADDVSACLRCIPDGLRFWELSEAEAAGPREEGSPRWHMNRAWSLLMGSPFVDVAVCHKTLHHKRPGVFPLLDRRTVRLLPKREAWGTIHRDLNAAAGEFEELERRFAEFAATQGGVSLTRLRLHDILLWCHASGDTGAARKAGAQILVGHAGG